MTARARWTTLGLALLALLGAAQAQGQNKFRLKLGAEGRVCFDCHPDFQDKLKNTFVHTPVKTGTCVACHSPHASSHGKLLAAPTSAICTTCHASVVGAKAVSAHKVVVEGGCVTCHDPHASNNKALLLKPGDDLCTSCHKALGDAVARVKFKHRPVSQGCLGCHDPHGSDNSGRLLKAAVPALCVGCHKPDSPSFARRHANYPVARADCTSCHDPHGSNTAGILFDTVHAPVAAGRCAQCHNAATAPEPLATRRAGFELCRGCHGTMLNEVFAKARVHWPLVDRTGCLNCHEAHASRQKKLVNVEETRLCGRCHRDTTDYQARLAEKARREQTASKVKVEKGAITHDPVRAGSCSTCHSPHASDSVRLLRSASIIDGCGACHDWLKHNSHPMGEKVTDLRNRNRSVDCLSCHRAHGTGYRYLTTFPTATDLCVQCHKQLRR